MSTVSTQLTSPATPLVTQQTFSVRMPRDAKTTKKKYSVLKFSQSNNVDFSKCGWAKIERENNLKDFKSAYDIETAPKFGAGSEYGRDQREEARKKKFGVRIRKYNSDDQPWMLKFGGGSGTQTRRFKGTREGGVTENASYYIFMQCSDGKAFEAYPVEEWYNFMPQIKYKCLDSEEAEQEFVRRDKTLNYFSIMLRKRLKNSDGTEDADEPEEKTKRKKASKSLVISEFDEMSNSSADDGDSSGSEGKDNEGKSKKKQKVKPKKESRAVKKKRKAEDEGEEDEAVEESDEMDEGEEVDYMSGSSSDDEMMYDDKARGESDKYQDKGVEDEEGLRKIVESGDEDEEDEEKKDEENEEDEESRAKEGKDKDNSESESSSDSDSDSDPEKDSNFASALFMTQEKRQVKQESSGSRPSTPANTPSAESVKKRKAENQSPLTVSKKIKSESSSSVPQPSASSSATTTVSQFSGSDGITEDAVRRYLMRKPMTTKELVQKFKSRNAGMSKEQMTMTIAQILKRLNPLQKKINGVMTLYLTTKPEPK